ncbi:hypothetical protein DQ240_21435 [Blastococcus sp. TF02A-26]|nr:hypothetical protein DQ240_21435 [Blastococcus sp. TF02A-26]
MGRDGTTADTDGSCGCLDGGGESGAEGGWCAAGRRARSGCLVEELGVRLATVVRSATDFRPGRGTAPDARAARRS